VNDESHGSHPAQLEDLAIVAKIRQSESSDDVVELTLSTDERVIARVTDGIYRHPGSAIRELISNAYDADATRVVIKTDAPRFDRIAIEDNGHGMTPEALTYLLRHIGGSAKRSEHFGPSLGITSQSDPMLSPKGRRLIGKIGIGLFSVSQLTHAFQIVTKTKDDAFRTVATVVLRQYADDDFPDDADSQRFESGKVNIWREPATDSAAHGTTIVLTSIRPQARDTLRSRDIWNAIEQSESTIEPDERRPIDPPKFHIGRVDKDGFLYKESSDRLTNVPWSSSDSPEEAFRKLVECVWREVNEGNPNPRLDQIFDYYLRMVWQLSLAIPIPYVDGHLFDIPLAGSADIFRLSNAARGGTQDVDVKADDTLRVKLGLTDSAESKEPFDVYLDDLKLLRPIKFTNLPTTAHALAGC
jgi:hypothetical protein